MIDYRDIAINTVGCTTCGRPRGSGCITTKGSNPGSPAQTHQARWDAYGRECPWSDEVLTHLPRNAAGQVGVVRKMAIEGWEGVAAAHALLRATQGLENTSIGLFHECSYGDNYAVLTVNGWRGE